MRELTVDLPMWEWKDAILNEKALDTSGICTKTKNHKTVNIIVASLLKEENRIK